MSETWTNYYGLPVIPAGEFDGLHVANPGAAGLPPVCSCGWTRWQREDGRWFEMADHLADQDPRFVGEVMPTT